MTAKEQQELTNMAINYDSLSPELKRIFVSQIGFGETIKNTSNASSFVGLLEEESREMVEVSKDGLIENNVKTFVYDEEIGKCNCGADGEDLHTCPFAEEIHDSSALCNCCKSCTHECAMDI